MFDKKYFENLKKEVKGMSLQDLEKRYLDAGTKGDLMDPYDPQRKEVEVELYHLYLIIEEKELAIN